MNESGDNHDIIEELKKNKRTRRKGEESERESWDGSNGEIKSFFPFLFNLDWGSEPFPSRWSSL